MPSCIRNIVVSPFFVSVCPLPVFYFMKLVFLFSVEHAFHQSLSFCALSFLRISFPIAEKHLNHWNFSTLVRFPPHNVACKMQPTLFYFY